MNDNNNNNNNNNNKLYIGMIEFIITHHELQPFNELGRQKTIELYPSIKTMIDITFMNNTYRQNRFYEFLCCKYHITILIYDLLHEKILFKLKYDTYKQYKEMIKHDAFALNLFE